MDMLSLELIPVAIVSLAALLDVRSRRIPNWLTLTAFIGGVAAQVLRAGPNGVVDALGGAALGLCLLLPFYAIRAIGAGDVKLLAAMGAWLGPQTLVSVAIYGALVGGAISIVLLVRRRTLARTFGDMLINPLRLRRSGATAPYGVAIASGVYLSMLLPSVVR
jgi:prepilin peptidase CpaA